MRLLFEMDKKDHEHCTHRFVRNSARNIIIRDGKIAMIHSLKYDYYKFLHGRGGVLLYTYCSCIMNRASAESWSGLCLYNRKVCKKTWRRDFYGKRRVLGKHRR